MYSRYQGYQPFDPMSNLLGNQTSKHADRREEPRYEERHERNDTYEQPTGASGQKSGGLLDGLLAGAGGLLGGAGGLFGGKDGLFGGKGGLFGGSGGLKSLFGGEGGIGKILNGLSLNWDSDDILLVLILLFMSRESDDEEILLLLGMILFLGL